MEIAVVGVNHNATPIEVREKVSFTESKKIEAISYLLDGYIDEVIILSTCNRSEIYIAGNCIENCIGVIKTFFKDFFDIDDIGKYIFIKRGKEAINHIYMVTSGMDSLVLGEDQILGQVKEALEFSMETGGSKKILNKLFRESITAAKDIKNTLKISEIPLSISYIGIKFLKEKLKSLEGKNALIIGVGKINTLTLKYLSEEKLNEIYITNRTHGKLTELQFEFPKCKMVEYDKRYEIIKDIDILITATAAPHIVVAYDKMPKLNKKIYMMDLALPRDVEEEVGKLDNVVLYDIDDLKKISEENMNRREEISKHAMDIIEKDVDEFIEWMEKTRVDPVIQSLNEKCKEIEMDTLEYIDRKLDLDCREKRIIEKMLSSALRRVVREPIRNLKEVKKDDDIEKYINTVNKLFDF